MLGRHWRRGPAEEGQGLERLGTGRQRAARGLAVRNASARPSATNGQTAAFHSWRIENGFNLPASAHTNLIAVMSALPSIEEWRSTLTETQRLRLNHPSAVLKNYRKAIAIKPAPKSVISPTAPAPQTP